MESEKNNEKAWVQLLIFFVQTDSKDALYFKMLIKKLLFLYGEKNQ